LMLSADVPGFQTDFEFSIPPADSLPVFAAQDSLYRLLLKCCAPDPNDRFVSADELRQQMLGVLREVVATSRSGVGSTAVSSTLFESPNVSGYGYPVGSMPRLRTDPSDPQASFLDRIAADPPRVRLDSLDAPPGWSKGVWLARGLAALETNQAPLLDQAVNRLLDGDPWEWRALWMAGLGALAKRDYAGAQSSFNAVYGQLPGELAPKLALAIACELGNEHELAEVLYRICSATDAAYVTAAAFGLSRIRRAHGDLAGSLTALAMVPSTSRGFPEAQRLRAIALVSTARDAAAIDAAFTASANARLGEQELAQSRALLLRRALFLAGQGSQITRNGRPVPPAALVDELAAVYRDLASHSAEPDKRAGYLELAISLRPWSLL